MYCTLPCTYLKMAESPKHVVDDWRVVCLCRSCTDKPLYVLWGNNVGLLFCYSTEGKEENDESVGNLHWMANILVMCYYGDSFSVTKGCIFWDLVPRTCVAKEQLRKHVPAKKNSWSTIGKGLSIARQRAVNKFCKQCRPCFVCGRCPSYIRKNDDCSTGLTGPRFALFKIPYVYDYITKLCRRQAEVILNHKNPNVRAIGQG
jgi:hypothetical protein